MDLHDLKKIDPYVLGAGAVAVVIAAFYLDLGVLAGTLSGAGFAVVNWRAFRSIGQRLVSGKRLRYTVLLGLKFLVVLGAVAAVLWYLPVSPVAFFVGMSSMFVGITAFAVRMMFVVAREPVEEDR